MFSKFRKIFSGRTRVQTSTTNFARPADVKHDTPVLTSRPFWKKWKKALIMGIFAAVLIVPRLAMAGPANAGGLPDGIDTGLAGVLIPVLKLLRSLLWPLLILIGNLLQNDLLFGGAMEERLLMIWTNIRDVVNIFFVLVLVGIAVYNVVGGGAGGEDYSIKTRLPKLIIGLIIVNFSFLGVKVALDGINVISTGIFALPSAAQVSLDEKFQERFCEAFYNADGKGYNIPASADEGGKQPFCTKDKKLNQGDPSIRSWFNSINRRNAAIVLALNFEKIDLISNIAVNAQDLEGGKVLINIMVSIILYVIYASSFIALFIVLLVRLIMLWLMSVLSPLMVLMYVLPEKVKSVISTGEDVAQQFIKHALVPIPVAFYMSIGIILLTALQNIKFPETSLSANTLGMDFLTSGISTLQELIIAVAAVAFVWKGVFDAMKDTYAGNITGGIKDFVGNAGKAIGKLPFTIPLFPLPTGNGKASLLELMKLARRLPDTVDQKVEADLGKHFGEALRGPEGITNEIKNASKLENVIESAKNNPLNRNKLEAQKALAKFLKDHQGEAAKIKRFTTQYPTREAFMKALESEKGIDPHIMEEFWNNNGVQSASATPAPPAGAKPQGNQPGAPAAVAATSSAAAWFDDKGVTDTLAKQGVTDNQVDALKNRSQYEKDAGLDKDEKAALDQLEKTLKDPKRPEGSIEKALNDKAQSALKKLENKKKEAAEKEKASEQAREDFRKNRDDQGISEEERIKRFDTILEKELEGVDFNSTKPEDKKKAQEALESLHEKYGKKFSDDQKKKLQDTKSAYDNSRLKQVLEYEPPKPAASGKSGTPPAGGTGTPPKK